MQPVRPLLPTAMTEVTPVAVRAFTVAESASEPLLQPPPRLMLTTEIVLLAGTPSTLFHSVAPALKLYTQPRPISTLPVQLRPAPSRTLTSYRSGPGAMPEVRPGEATVPAPWPRMVPATCVPWKVAAPTPMRATSPALSSF